ncbi:hypothetical protein HPB47_000333 [Ixodes persulcatus]|uniref:Uncharacterized protein n=1 Tax=Ixodes persulcatus TaxID=34615 RepID=A0AC60PTM4_IXOPE|nr:hypothetical protein HPB47_000333 [Ixodes persulcatus]
MENPIRAKLENARDVASHMHGCERTNPSHSFGLHSVWIVRPSRLCLAMHSYTVQKKIKVVEWHRRNGKNVHLTARQFKLDRKRIREW